MEEDRSSLSTQADVSPWSAHELEITTPAHKYLASSGEEGDDKFKNVAPPLPRYGHSSLAVASPAGDVLIFGGRVDDRVKNDTWAIRLSEDSGPSDNVIRRKVTANLIDTTGEAPSARSEHASALVDKWLVVWGGCFGFLQFTDDCVYLLDTTTNIWTKLVLQPAPPVRDGHAACACGNKFVMFGGYGGRSGYFNDIWTIDLDSLAQRTPKWEQIKVARGSESPSGRAGHSIVAHKNKLHVFGGDQYTDIWCFDLSTRVWKKLRQSGSIPPPLSFHAAALVGDTIYIFGGTMLEDDTWYFQIDEQKWYTCRNVPFRPIARSQHIMATIGGRVIVIGGKGGFGEKVNKRTTVNVLDTNLIASFANQKEVDRMQMSHIEEPSVSHLDPFRTNISFSRVFDNSSRSLIKPVSMVVEAPIVEAKLGSTGAIESSAPLGTLSKGDDLHLRQDTDRVTHDVITGAMPAEEILKYLVGHGCHDITQELDISHVSEYAVSAGGFGDVYHAKLRNGNRVGMKCVRFQVNNNERGKKVLKHAAHELYVWSKCQHPNVLELLGVMLFRGQIAMVSPWLENGHLRWFLERNPDVDRCALCLQITNGVDYLHQSSIVHGDLKPENILISKDHVPKLADFGNATLAEYTLGFTHSSTTQSMTLRWTAPEVIKGETKPTQASDIYALGMVIYEVVTRSIPFDGVSDFAIMFTVVGGKIPARPEVHVPQGKEQADRLWTMLIGCWTYNPKERPKAHEIKNTINGITAGGLLGNPS